MPDGAARKVRAAREAQPVAAVLPDAGPGVTGVVPCAFERVRAGAAALRVGGFVPFTTTDFPSALAAVVFSQGCPWRCAYCHNPHLIPARVGDGEGAGGAGVDGEAGHDFACILNWLGTRRGLLDAVVFSGGEPTAQPELPEAIAAVRERGFRIGLHTAGAYPRRLAQVLPLVDWVGLDVKAPFAGYASVTGAEGSGDAAFASLDLIRDAGVAFEVRTTVHPALLSPDVLARLARELAERGIDRWVLQPFRPTGCAERDLVATAPRGAALEAALLARLRGDVPAIEVRV
jgi:pyruvate formate lyase activating enzyme